MAVSSAGAMGVDRELPVKSAATTAAARRADRAYQPTPEDERMALMSLVMHGMETEQFAEIVKSAELKAEEINQQALQ